jgi:iron complex outermembrane receptor protein
LECEDHYFRTRFDPTAIDALDNCAWAVCGARMPPAANADGLIFVHPGDHLPMNPENRIALSTDYDVTAPRSVGGDLRFQSSQYLVGDESNQEPPLSGFTIVKLHTSYRVTSNIQLFGEIENLFDARHYTYGAFTELDALPPNFDLTNPRTYSPAPGRLFCGGVRVETV